MTFKKVGDARTFVEDYLEALNRAEFERFVSRWYPPSAKYIHLTVYYESNDEGGVDSFIESIHVQDKDRNWLMQDWSLPTVKEDVKNTWYYEDADGTSAFLQTLIERVSDDWTNSLRNYTFVAPDEDLEWEIGSMPVIPIYIEE